MIHRGCQIKGLFFFISQNTTEVICEKYRAEERPRVSSSPLCPVVLCPRGPLLYDLEDRAHRVRKTDHEFLFVVVIPLLPSSDDTES